MVESFCRAVDKINDTVGKWSSLLFLPLTIIVTFDVIARKFFNSPTIWAGDINVQLACVLVVLGGGYLLIKNGHVIVDVIVNKFSKKARAILDMVTGLLFFLGVGWVLYYAVIYAQKSVASGERMSTLWEPYLWPLKIVVAIGFFLLLLQGIVNWIRDFRIATGAADKGVKA